MATECKRPKGQAKPTGHLGLELNEVLGWGSRKVWWALPIISFTQGRGNPHVHNRSPSFLSGCICAAWHKAWHHPGSVDCMKDTSVLPCCICGPSLLTKYEPQRAGSLGECESDACQVISMHQLTAPSPAHEESVAIISIVQRVRPAMVSKTPTAGNSGPGSAQGCLMSETRSSLWVLRGLEKSPLLDPVFSIPYSTRTG